MNADRSEEHTSELQSPCNLVCRLLLEKKKNKKTYNKLQKTIFMRTCRYTRASSHRYTYAQCSVLFGSNTLILFFLFFFFFFFNDTATTEIYTLSLHDALPI